MTPRLLLEHAALSEEGPTVALTAFSGQSVAIVGRAGSGKSRFLEMLGGRRNPARGQSKLLGTAGFVEPVLSSRRLKPQLLGARGGRSKDDRATILTEALVATNLWDVRRTIIADLTDGQKAAAALIEPLIDQPDILFCDGFLDLLDPWTQHKIMSVFEERAARGKSLVAVTNLPQLAEKFDIVIVLKASQVTFAGSPSDLKRSMTLSRLEVHTDSVSAVKNLVQPFEVTITEERHGLLLEAAEGQALAARLLLEGYGDVKFVALRQPTMEEALLALS